MWKFCPNLNFVGTIISEFYKIAKFSTCSIILSFQLYCNAIT